MHLKLNHRFKKKLLAFHGFICYAKNIPLYSYYDIEILTEIADQYLRNLYATIHAEEISLTSCDHGKTLFLK